MSTEFRFSRIAHEAELADRRQASVAGLREAEVHAPRRRQEPARVAPVLLEYLRLVLATPGVSATERDATASYSAATGSRRRASLLKLGLVEEFVANPGGQGAAFKDIRLTPAGLELLERS